MRRPFADKRPFGPLNNYSQLDDPVSLVISVRLKPQVDNPEEVADMIKDIVRTNAGSAKVHEATNTNGKTLIRIDTGLQRIGVRAPDSIRESIEAKLRFEDIDTEIWSINVGILRDGRIVL